MPKRKVALVNEQQYHIFNRSVDGKLIFRSQKDYYRFLSSAVFLKNHIGPFSTAFKHRNYQEILFEILNLNLNKNIDKRVEIVCFCMMPNHFHFVLKQLREDGIRDFISAVQLGYAKYYNITRNRKGRFWMSEYQSVYIKTDEQLIKTINYIHLNPVKSSKVQINSFESLTDYKFSSLREYLGLDKPAISAFSTILDNKRAQEMYKSLIISEIEALSNTRD